MALARWVCWTMVAMMLMGEDRGANGGEVVYDGRSLIIDGQRKILFSGSIHYPRSTPEMWPSLIAKAKEGGLDVIQTYVFWNLHEPRPCDYDFGGRYDLVRFIKDIQAQGLYACLRIGPFIESEWTYGGFPFWLHDVPDIIYRSDNEPFKFYMQNFTTKIVNLMKAEGLYASQGGPIILSQIENEYQNIEAAFKEKGPSYVRWAAAMAVKLQTGVPWVMCKQSDAPDPVINTCNGMRCDETFQGPNSPSKPSMWTENWTSFYQVFGGEPYIRSAEDIAFHVVLFIAKKGCYVNYYMYHGGTNFGRRGAAYVTTSYYDEAPLDEYGLTRQPKWGHLKQLHAAINLCSTTLLHGVQTNFSLGQLQVVISHIHGCFCIFGWNLYQVASVIWKCSLRGHGWSLCNAKQICSSTNADGWHAKDATSSLEGKTWEWGRLDTIHNQNQDASEMVLFFAIHLMECIRACGSKCSCRPCYNGEHPGEEQIHTKC